MALVAVTLLAVGPLVALVVVISSDEGPVVTLVASGPVPEDGARLTATLIGVAPTAGEMRARIVLEPQAGLLEDNRLDTELVLGVNDIGGQTTYEFAAGEPLQPVEVSLALASGSVKRYPFDRYDATLFLALAEDQSGQDQPVPFSLDINSNVDEFDVSVVTPEEGEEAPNLTGSSPAALVEFKVARETTTTFYSALTMALMWALAIVGVVILWSVIIWQVEVPWWGVGYFVGVLFALPQLREVLPGRPPPGTLLDFVAFYWSIAILGVSLIVLLAVWIQRTRPRKRVESPESAVTDEEPSGPPGPDEGPRVP